MCGPAALGCSSASTTPGVTAAHGAETAFGTLMATMVGGDDARATAFAPAVLGLTEAGAHRVPGGCSVAVAPGSVVAATLSPDRLAWPWQSYTQLGAPRHVIPSAALRRSRSRRRSAR
jgi:hypothetical protein